MLSASKLTKLTKLLRYKLNKSALAKQTNSIKTKDLLPADKSRKFGLDIRLESSFLVRKINQH